MGINIINYFRLCSAIAIAGLMCSCGNSSADGRRRVEELNLGHHTFRIPEKNAKLLASPSWLQLLSGLDDGARAALIRFKGQDVKESIPTYQIRENQIRDDIEVMLMVLTSEEVERYHDPQYAQLEDLWHMRGSYTNRRVEIDEKFGWYRVYREAEYPQSWAYLNQFPDINKAVPSEPLDFWVAHCLLMGPNDDKIASCKSYELMGDVVIEFSVSDYNLPVLSATKEFLRTSIQSWMDTNDDGQPREE